MKPIEGNVLKADNGTRLAVINVGKAGGVTRGYVFSIARGSEYIGQLEIDSVYENVSAGTVKLLAPGAEVRTGDRVTTTLN